MVLDKPTKDVVSRGIISNNSPKLLYDAVIFKNWKKNRELVFSIIARDLFKGKKGFLLHLVVYSEVGIDC